MKPLRLFPLLFLSVLFLSLPGLADSEELGANLALNTTETVHVPPGPWGELDYFTLILEPSDFFLSLLPDLKTWPKGTIWKFQAENAEEVRRLLVDSGLSLSQSVQLTSEEFFKKGETFLEIRPPPEAIEGLTSDQRNHLYGKLRPFNNQNAFHAPFCLMPGGIRQHNAVPSSISPEQINLIERLSYYTGNAGKFSDISYLLSKAEDDFERRQIIRLLCRESSLSVRLSLNEQSNLPELVKYWSANGRNKDILPILESVTQTSGVDKLDIVHLLPPTPRKLLNTFPPVSGYRIRDIMPDCFWTAFGFFAENPPDRHLDFVMPVFEERYERVQPPLQLGDLIVMIDQESGEWKHACNHIAADLVYTKNGNSMGRPWVIDRLERVANLYLQSKTLNVIFFRLKSEYRR